MVIFELTDGSRIKMHTGKWMEHGKVEFDQVTPELFNTLITSVAKTGGVPAMYDEDGEWFGLPPDIEFALLGAGMSFSISGKFMKSKDVIDKNRVY